MASDWAYLPENLLDSVLEKLTLSARDYLRFSIVCKPWLSVAKENQSRYKKMLSHQEPPMLLFFNAKEDAWSLYNVVDNKVLDNVQLKMPNKRFCGSSMGWLMLVEEDFSVTLINPFLRAKQKSEDERGNSDIHLPRLVPPDKVGCYIPLEKEAHADICEFYVVKAILTADPISNTKECIVVVTEVKVRQMAFTRIGDDKWTFVDTHATDILQIGDNKLCAIQQYVGEVTIFSFTSESYSVKKYSLCPHHPPPEPFNSSIREYLVQTRENELLVVLRCCDWDVQEEETVDKRFTTDITVFKFDFDKCMWIEKTTLGDDAAIFIGENMAIHVVASNFPGCKPNCVYYNHDYDSCQMDDVLCDFGVYDMKTEKISKPYSTELMSLLEMINQRPIWFTPTFYL